MSEKKKKTESMENVELNNNGDEEAMSLVSNQPYARRISEIGVFPDIGD